MFVEFHVAAKSVGDGLRLRMLPFPFDMETARKPRLRVLELCKIIIKELEKC